MGIDIYKNRENKNRLFSISDELYEILDKEIISKYEKLTGVFIDNYGTSRLSPQHSEFFSRLLRDCTIGKNNPVSKELAALIKFLEETSEKNIDLEFVGD